MDIDHISRVLAAAATALALGCFALPVQAQSCPSPLKPYQPRHLVFGAV